MNEPRHFRKKVRSPDTIFEHGKIPPQAIDMEEAVLGGIMLEDSHDYVHAIIHKMKPEMFYKDAHQVICKAIKELEEKGSAIDILLVTEHLRFMGELDVAGGPYYLTLINNKISSTANIDWHFRIIYQKYIQREIIRICSENIRESYEDTTDCFTQLEQLTDSLDHLDPKLAETRTVTASALADEMVKEFESIKVNTHTNIIIPTMTYSLGWPRFDEVVTIGRDKIILIGGPAKGGKSKFIHQIICRLLELYVDISVKWISLEDSRQDLLRSYIASKVLITAKHIKMRKFDKTLIPSMLHYTQRFKNFDIEFVDEAIKSIDIIYEFTRFCEQRKGRFNLLVVDNMKSLDDKELFKNDQNSLDNYVLHNMLKCRQKTKGCLFLLHHFNDSQMDKENIKIGYRPILKDIKGSEGFRSVPNQVLLINSFSIYKDLMSQYSQEDKEILKRLFIVDTGANRENKIDDESGLIHFVQDLGFNLFHEIPIPIIQAQEQPKIPMEIMRDIPF